MRFVTQLGTALMAVVMSWHVAAATARACSGLQCTPSIYFPSSGTVPANLPGFYWWPSVALLGVDDDGGAPRAPAELLRFARVDGAAPELLEVEVEEPDGSWKNGPHLIVPKQPLVPGAKYVLWDATRSCRELPSLEVPPARQLFVDGTFGPSFYTGQARIEVAEAAALPTELGALSAGDAMSGTMPTPDGAGCSVERDVVFSEIEVAHAPSARAWADVLFYRTDVDGKPYNPVGDYHQRFYALDYDPGTSLAGRGYERVFAECSEPSVITEGVDQGAHRARIRAAIPGTDLDLQTDEVQVDLHCPRAPMASTDKDSGAEDVPADGAAGFDAASGDGGGKPRVHEGRPRERADNGCSVGSAPITSAWPLGLALCLLARRRAGARLTGRRRRGRGR